MPRKRHTLEQIIGKLREAEVGSAGNSMDPLRGSPQCNSQRRSLGTPVAILATTFAELLSPLAAGAFSSSLSADAVAHVPFWLLADEMCRSAECLDLAIERTLARWLQA